MHTFMLYILHYILSSSYVQMIYFTRTVRVKRIRNSLFDNETFKDFISTRVLFFKTKNKIYTKKSFINQSSPLVICLVCIRILKV